MEIEAAVAEAVSKTDTQKTWENEIQAAEKELEPFIRRGREVSRKFMDKRESVQETFRWFNLFNSNVNLLTSSLYNHLPKPDVNRRFKDSNDQIGRVAALILERALTYEIECTPEFDEALKGAIQDRLVPGLGTVWVRYDVEQGPPLEEGGEATIKDERSPIDFVLWEDFVWGPSRTWAEVPWVGRKHFMDKAKLIETFGEEQAETIPLNYEGTTKKDNDNTLAPKQTESKRALVYEIWDKASKSVIYVCCECEDVLKTTEDVIGFDGFFPCPKPMLACHTTSNLVPTPDYYFAQDQYQELNAVNQRISKLVEACKVAGVYDKTNEGLKNLLTQENENTLIPVSNWALFSERGGVKGTIDWIPLDQIVKTLQQLYDARDRIKQQLYEVTGLSDILRGATKASETAKAQEIKAEFAGIRLSALQREVAEFVRDLLNLKAQIICRVYGDEKIMSMVGVLQPADAELAPQAIAMLRDDFLRMYRVDIDVDSLTAADWQREKGMRMEFLTAVSNFLREAIPAAQMGEDMSSLLMTMLKFGVAGFRSGREIEGEIDNAVMKLKEQAAQPKPPPKPSPDEMKMQLEQQKFQMTQQAEGAKLQQENERHQMEMQHEREKFQQEMAFEREKFQMEMQQAAQEAQAKMALEVGKARMQADTRKHEFEEGTKLEREKLQMIGTEKGLPQANASLESMQNMMQVVLQAVSQLTQVVAESSAEKEFVLDPKTGKPVGVRRKQESVQ